MTRSYIIAEPDRQTLPLHIKILNVVGMRAIAETVRKLGAGKLVVLLRLIFKCKKYRQQLANDLNIVPLG